MSDLVTIRPQDAEGLDPALPAPPVVVDIDPQHDMPGHGRTIPLVGGVRQYLFDVAYAGGTKRVYADDARDAVAFVIGGQYPDLVAQAKELEGAGEPDEDALIQVRQRMMRARYEHADRTRAALQGVFNEAAQESGAWSVLPSEERDILTAAGPGADSRPPMGVIAMGYRIGDADDAPMRDFGIWDAAVPLVLNTGDYEPFTDIAEPESMARYGVDSGPYAGMVMPGDVNLVRLVIWNGGEGIEDDDSVYLRSLSEAGAVQVTMREADQPDPMFAVALESIRDPGDG